MVRRKRSWCYFEHCLNFLHCLFGVAWVFWREMEMGDVDLYVYLETKQSIFMKMQSCQIHFWRLHIWVLLFIPLTLALLALAPFTADGVVRLLLLLLDRFLDDWFEEETWCCDELLFLVVALESCEEALLLFVLLVILMLTALSSPLLMYAVVVPYWFFGLQLLFTGFGGLRFLLGGPLAPAPPPFRVLRETYMFVLLPSSSSSMSSGSASPLLPEVELEDVRHCNTKWWKMRKQYYSRSSNTP